MQPSQSGHARRSHNHSRSSNLTPSPSSGKEPPPLQPSRSETVFRNMNPFGQTQTQQKPGLPQQQSSFDVLSAPTKKIKPNQNSFAENVRGVPHDVRFAGEKDLAKMEREPNTDMTEHDYQVKISKHIIGEGQHMKPQDIAQKGQHLPQGMDSVWNKRSNLQVLSQFPGEKNRFLEDPMLKEEDVPSQEMDNTGLIIPSLKKPSANFTGNNDILPLSNLYSQLKRQQMEQQLLQQQQQQQQHLAMLQARQQLLLQQQEAKLIQQHMMKQIQPLDLYLQQQQQQQQLARQFQQNFNKYDQMSLINARKMGSQDVSEMLASHQHPVFQYNNMLLAQQQHQQAGLNPHLASGLNQRLNFNRQGENESEISTSGKNLEATEKIANKMMIPELKYEDTIIKREEVASASESSSKLPPSRKKNSISSLEDNSNNNNKKNQKSSAATIESTPVSHATDNTKESARARRKNKWQMLAEQQAQQPKGNEGIDLGELDPVQIARSNTVYIEGVSEEKCTDCDFLLKVIITDDPRLIGHENAKNDFKAITDYSLENRKVHSGEQYQVNVPAVSLRPSRPIRKKPLEPIWDPSAISKDELRGYFEDLSKGLNCKNINQERALKLLKRKNYKREKVQVNISKNEKFYSSFLAVAEDTAAATVQETAAIGESEQQEEPSG